MSAQILALLELDENSQQVVRSLTEAGFEIIACQSFTEAIEILKTQPKIEMIISDVHLENGGNVFDFLRWVRASGAYAGTSLVLFSFRPTLLAKHLEDGVRTSARMLGLAQYITMEIFEPELFCKKIQLIISKQHGFLDQRLDEDIKLRLAARDKHSP